MLLTPLLLVALDRWCCRAAAPRRRRALDEISEPQDAPVIIAGFGRYGQIVGRMLCAQRPRSRPCSTTTPTRSRALRRFGCRVFYGDATRLDLLRTAGAGTARVLVVAIDDIEQIADASSTWRASTSRNATHRRARAQRAALVRAARPRRDADRARDVRVGAAQRAQRARGAGLAAARGARSWRMRFRRHNIAADARDVRRTTRTAPS